MTEKQIERPEVLPATAREKGQKICPECKRLGLKSRIYSTVENQTLMAVQEFWDEDGYFHRHDPNQYARLQRCSNGHNWTEYEDVRCWCERE